MLVYRITLEKWSSQLFASGKAARWNSAGKSVIYTAGSRALASLENVVHRNRKDLTRKFKTMVIEIPDHLKIESIELKDLPENWREFTSYSLCQSLGNAWVERCASPVLSVPSAIIPEERNFLLNPNHPDFQLIKLVRVEDFVFDSRIKVGA